MAFGDLLIRLSVPLKPTNATETEAEYSQKVKTAADGHFDATGINPARLSWSNRSDVPDDREDAPDFARDLIAGTSIDTDEYTFGLASTTTTYCIVNGEVRLYHAISVTRNDNDASSDEFVFAVALDNNLSVTIQIRLVVRTLHEFPGGETADARAAGATSTRRAPRNGPSTNGADNACE